MSLVVSALHKHKGFPPGTEVLLRTPGCLERVTVDASKVYCVELQEGCALIENPKAANGRFRAEDMTVRKNPRVTHYGALLVKCIRDKFHSCCGMPRELIENHGTHSKENGCKFHESGNIYSRQQLPSHVQQEYHSRYGPSWCTVAGCSGAPATGGAFPAGTYEPGTQTVRDGESQCLSMVQFFDACSTRVGASLGGDAALGARVIGDACFRMYGFDVANVILRRLWFNASLLHNPLFRKELLKVLKVQTELRSEPSLLAGHIRGGTGPSGQRTPSLGSIYNELCRLVATAATLSEAEDTGASRTTKTMQSREKSGPIRRSVFEPCYDVNLFAVAVGNTTLLPWEVSISEADARMMVHEQSLLDPRVRAWAEAQVGILAVRRRDSNDISVFDARKRYDGQDFVRAPLLAGTWVQVIRHPVIMSQQLALVRIEKAQPRNTVHVPPAPWCGALGGDYDGDPCRIVPLSYLAALQLYVYMHLGQMARGDYCEDETVAWMPRQSEISGLCQLWEDRRPVGEFVANAIPYSCVTGLTTGKEALRNALCLGLGSNVAERLFRELSTGEQPFTLGFFKRLLKQLHDLLHASPLVLHRNLFQVVFPLLRRYLEVHPPSTQLKAVVLQEHANAASLLRKTRSHARGKADFFRESAQKHAGVPVLHTLTERRARETSFVRHMLDEAIATAHNSQTSKEQIGIFSLAQKGIDSYPLMGIVADHDGYIKKDGIVVSTWVPARDLPAPKTVEMIAKKHPDAKPGPHLDKFFQRLNEELGNLPFDPDLGWMTTDSLRSLLEQERAGPIACDELCSLLGTNFAECIGSDTMRLKMGSSFSKIVQSALDLNKTAQRGKGDAGAMRTPILAASQGNRTQALLLRVPFGAPGLEHLPVTYGDVAKQAKVEPTARGWRLLFEPDSYRFGLLRGVRADLAATLTEAGVEVAGSLCSLNFDSSKQDAAQALAEALLLILSPGTPSRKSHVCHDLYTAFVDSVDADKHRGLLYCAESLLLTTAGRRGVEAKLEHLFVRALFANGTFHHVEEWTKKLYATARPTMRLKEIHNLGFATTAMHPQHACYREPLASQLIKTIEPPGHCTGSSYTPTSPTIPYLSKEETATLNAQRAAQSVRVESQLKLSDMDPFVVRRGGGLIPSHRLATLQMQPPEEPLRKTVLGFRVTFQISFADRRALFQPRHVDLSPSCNETMPRALFLAFRKGVLRRIQEKHRSRMVVIARCPNPKKDFLVSPHYPPEMVALLKTQLYRIPLEDTVADTLRVVVDWSSDDPYLRTRHITPPVFRAGWENVPLLRKPVRAQVCTELELVVASRSGAEWAPASLCERAFGFKEGDFELFECGPSSSGELFEARVRNALGLSEAQSELEVHTEF